MSWVRPYLRNIQRLQLDQSKTETPDLLVAFESSMMEVELLARKPSGKVNQCLLMSYLFRTRPELNYQQEGYQRGPIHLGRVEIDFRVYAWTDEQIQKYKKMREEEDFQLLGIVDSSVKAAMESLGDELARYLGEAGEDMSPKSKITGKKSSIISPYTSIFKGFSEVFGRGKKPKKQLKPKKTSKTELMKFDAARKDASEKAKQAAWIIYHHFKKHHGMLNW